MKATQLEQMKMDYMHIKSTRSVTSEKVEEQREVRINQDWFSFISLNYKIPQYNIQIKKKEEKVLCSFLRYPTTKMYLLLFLFKQQRLDELKQDYLGKKKSYESLASVTEMQTKLEELKNHMAWALVSSFSPPKSGSGVSFVECNTIFFLELLNILTDFLQVAEAERAFEPMKEKLESDRRATDKFDEKVEEWKVSFKLAILPFFTFWSTFCVRESLTD